MQFEAPRCILRLGFAVLGMTAAALGEVEVRCGEAADRASSSRSSPLRQRYLSITIVGLIHVAVLWGLTIGMRPPAPIRGGVPELQIRLLSPNLGPREPLAPALDWTFDTPEAVPVPEPQIVIAPDRGAGDGIAGGAITLKLAPRLDPGHVNQRPELPRTMGGIIAALSLELRILVLPDGTVENAEVVRSSGQGEIDRLAMDTVRNSWRYLPASVDGKPIEAWTTVIVRFVPF